MTKPLETLSGSDAAAFRGAIGPHVRGVLQDDLAKLAAVQPEATKNSSDAALRDRGSHTGTQGIETIQGLSDALAGKASTAQGGKAETALQPGASATQIAYGNRTVGDVLGTVEAKLPLGFTNRSAVWAVLDKIGRKLRFIGLDGRGYSNIPERFNRNVQFLGGVSESFSMTGYRIEGLGDPNSDDDAVSRGFVTTLLGSYLTRAGGSMTGQLNMQGFTLTGLPAPAANGDAVRLAEFSPVALKLPSNFGARARIAWALLDSAKRKLRFIDGQGIGWSNIPERFNKAVQFLGTVSFTGRIGFSQLTLGASNVDLPAGYSRSGYIRAWIDSNRRVLFGLRKGGTVWAFGKQLATLSDLSAVAPAPSYIPPLLRPADGIAAALGDSLTVGTGGTPWATQLATLIGGGFTASIYGYGGRKSQHIGGRVGTTLTFVTASGGAISGNGGVTTITAVSNNLLWLPSDGVQTEKGRVVGYGASTHGTLTGTTTSGVTAYTFTSDAGTATIKCGPETLFIPDNRAAITGKELWCAPGRNNYDDPATVKANQDDMIAFYRPTVKRIMLFAVINGNYSGEYAGGANWEIIRDLNYDRRQKYPNHFVVDSQGRDLRERLVASYDPTLSLDVHAHENDYPPHSLRSTSANVTTLSADVNDSATVLTVTDGARIHDNALLIIGTEKMALVGRSGNQLTVTRGYAGTTPAAHVSGDAIATDDKVHLNTAGYGVWAQIGFEFRQASIL